MGTSRTVGGQPQPPARSRARVLRAAGSWFVWVVVMVAVLLGLNWTQTQQSSTHRGASPMVMVVAGVVLGTVATVGSWRRGRRH